MDGLLLIDKSIGWTSHDVVAKVRGVLKAAAGRRVKVGHTGTLDPAASGVLVLVVGSYTKRAGEFSKLDKTYEVELTLGAVSSTGDSEGEIAPKSTQKPSESEIRRVLNTFLGEISQTPPAYSAVKINGRRAYKAARAGEAVKLEPRQVTIYEISNIKYDYPKLSFTASVSSGTYIRSLAADIGQQLGVGAYLSALRRTKVGDFDVADAVVMDNIDYHDAAVRFVTI
ncbi:MAG TPA: tRNA pseudouridine(55) synthase TruB [Candidatus Saccharimonadales bacterium]|nr:tRNA pseudouridine(55) synthase TruB [Candidatus Saccharimonadales bacterium]